MNRAATIALAPISLLYGAVVATRSALYARGILKTQKVNAPVISVGNITTGGTGKSPLVEWIARRLTERGLSVCILTRGYGRRDPHQRVVVSDGNTILDDVEYAGDEPLMLAEALPGVAVVCDSDRVAAANWAIENLKSDVLILDDGFQHLRIDRDLDIVTIDATNAYGNGWFLPAGSLREPRNNLRRAECIVVTRTASEESGLTERLRDLTGAPVLKSRTVMKQLRNLNAERPVEWPALRNTSFAAFCGIGNPKAFFQQLQHDGFDLRHTASFRDHHEYSQSDIDHLVREASTTGAQALVTTAKDAVKLRSLRFDLSCYVVEIEIEVAEAERLLQLIDAAITRA